MSLETKTYTELLSQIKAKFGVSGLSSSEEDMIPPLVNARAFEAYQSSQNWPRYLVTGQPRSINKRQVIKRTEDSFYVQNAGTEGVNGLYDNVGTFNDASAYSLRQYSPSFYKRSDAISFFIRPGGGKYLADGTTLYIIRKNSSGEWELVEGTSYDDSSATVLYKNTSGATPDLGSFETVSGQSDAPTVTGLSNISEYLRVHQMPSFVNLSSREFEFYVTADGAHMLNLYPANSTVAYVTYKKDFSEFSTSSTDIPREWFYFLASSVYSDLLRMQGRNEQAQTEDALSQNYLSNEMERVNNINNTHIIRKFSTYTARQAR